MKQSRRAFVRTLFAASQAVVVSQFLPASLLAGSPEIPAPDGLNFLVFGDWGINGERGQTEVAAQMALAAKKLTARFVVSVGDNFYEHGVKDVHDPQWQSSFERVYTDPALQVPWHVILGNHDYQGVCDAQLAYAKTSARWKMPARYFQQTHQLTPSISADFFYLDTSPMVESYKLDARMGPQIRAQDVPTQLEWFKNALASSKAQWKIVFGHHPIYSGGMHGDTPELINRLLPLLRKHQVQAWFNGHDHDLQHLQADGVNLFCSGAGSEFLPTWHTAHTKFHLPMFSHRPISGFTTVNLAVDKMDVSMIDNHGTQLYAVTVPRSG